MERFPTYLLHDIGYSDLLPISFVISKILKDTTISLCPNISSFILHNIEEKKWHMKILFYFFLSLCTRRPRQTKDQTFIPSDSEHHDCSSWGVEPFSGVSLF